MITWTGNGGAFTILGSLFCLQGATNGFRGDDDPTPASLWGAGGPHIRTIDTQIAAIVDAHTPEQEKYYDGIQQLRNAAVSAQQQLLVGLQAQAAAELIAIVNADNPQPDLTLTTALNEFIRQMYADSETVMRCVVGATVTATAGNIGSPTILCSTTGRFGRPQEYAIEENLVATVTGDAAGNGAGGTAGQEPIQIVAPIAGQHKLAENWPQGSGSSTTVNIINPNVSAGANLLTNSNFENYSGTTPDNWVITVGNSSDVKKSTSPTFGDQSAFAIQFVGDGATLFAIVQEFNSGAGTTAALRPATVYGVNFWLNQDVVPAAGVLALELIDSTGAILNDDEGNPMSASRSLPALAALTWINCGGFFRTPTNLPTTGVKLRIRASTAISAGTKVNVDFGAMGIATQLYPSGPYVIAFRGEADPIFGDNWTIAITNGREGQFQTWFERNFDMTTLGLILPSDAAPTIPENLIA